MKSTTANRSSAPMGIADPFESNLEIARMLTSILDEIHPHLKAHLKRVANNTASFCEKNKLLNQQKIERIYLVALVHDIGKIALSSDLVTEMKASKREESLEFRRHPVIGEKILSNVSAFEDLLPIVRHHHERYDGKGYPDNKSAGEIPLESRVVALFDHLDMLMHPSSPDEPASLEAALNDITVKSGQYFDPDLIERFVEFVKEGGSESEDYTLKKELSTLRKLFTEMSVHENLELGAYPKQAWAQREETLKLVYKIFPILEERAKQQANTLSGGEQQMLAMGRGLMSQPKMVIIDEPSNGLAPKLVLDVFQIVKSITLCDD